MPNELETRLSKRQKIYRESGHYWARVDGFGTSGGKDCAWVKTKSGSTMPLYDGELGTLFYTRKQLEDRSIPRLDVPDDEPKGPTRTGGLLCIGHRLFKKSDSSLMGAVKRFDAPSYQRGCRNTATTVLTTGVFLFDYELNDVCIGRRPHV